MKLVSASSENKSLASSAVSFGISLPFQPQHCLPRVCYHQLWGQFLTGFFTVHFSMSFPWEMQIASCVSLFIQSQQSGPTSHSPKAARFCTPCKRRPKRKLSIWIYKFFTNWNLKTSLSKVQSSCLATLLLIHLKYRLFRIGEEMKCACQSKPLIR